jgi:alpha-glucosidase
MQVMRQPFVIVAFVVMSATLVRCSGSDAVKDSTDTSPAFPSDSSSETDTAAAPSDSGDSLDTNDPVTTASSDSGTSDSATQSGDGPDTGTAASDSDSATGTAAIGEFLVTHTLDADGGLSLSVAHKDEPERPIWETPPGQPFLAARLVKTTFEQWHGSFTITEKQQDKCGAQTVDSLLAGAKRFVVTGGFEGCEVRYGFTLTPASARQLAFDVSLNDAPVPGSKNAVWRASLLYSSDPDEGFFGFGEQYTHFNLKGRKLPILVQEQGHGRGLEPLSTLLNTFGKGAAGDWYTTYSPVPQYITNTNRCLFLENYEYSTFDFTDDDLVTIEPDAGNIRGRIVYGKSPLELVEEYTTFSGRMPPLPDWMGQGAVVGLQGGSEVVRSTLAMLDEHDIALAALWLQDWVGQRETTLGTRLWWNWEVDRRTYPDWEGLVAELNDRGVRVMGYLNPFLTDAKDKPGVEHNFYPDAVANNYLLRDLNGKPKLIESGGFSGALVDFSNPEARAWLKGVIQDQLIGKGLAGWMADFGEAVPFDTMPFSGESPRTYHNRYPEEWAALTREAIEEAGALGEIVSFHRTGFRRGPASSTLFWVGDQLASWDQNDGIKTALVGLLSSGLSGYSINHSDVGGCIAFDYVVLKYLRTAELLVRWMELNAFSPVFRNHEGNNPEKSGEQIYSTPELLDAMARFTKVFVAMSDYRKGLLREASERGWPVVRPLLLHYPEDPEVWKLDHQLMLGSEILVAPVLDEGAKVVEAYLPKGEWVHLFTGHTYGSKASGVWVTIDAPLGEPAAFYKSGSAAGESIRQTLLTEGIAR